jgi:WD40 repeat protein
MSIIATALLLASGSNQGLTVTPGKTIDGLRPIAFAAAPTGSKFVACMEDGSVRVIDAKTRQTVRMLDKHPQPAYAAAWSPDGLRIAVGDETARVWIHSAVSGQKLREYRCHIRGIEKLSFNVGGNLLISTGKDDTIKVYNLDNQSPKEAVNILGNGANFYGAIFSPKLSTTFVTGILGPGARFYDATTGKVSGFLTGHDNQGVFDMAFNSTGTRAVSAGRDGTAIVWDTKSDKKIASLKGHQDWVMDVAYAPNGKLIATSSTDRTVKVWNAYSYQKVADLSNESFVGSPICFTADGNTLVTVNDQGFLQFNNIGPAQAAAPSTVAKKPVKPAIKNAARTGKG